MRYKPSDDVAVRFECSILGTADWKNENPRVTHQDSIISLNEVYNIGKTQKPKEAI